MSSGSPLREFALSPLAHTGLFGVFLGVHAVEGALDVLHTGVGCKAKSQAQLVHHDRGRESHTRVGWTELREEELIRDPGASLITAIRELHDRRSPQLMLITASNAVEFTGPDMQKLAAEAQAEIGCPVRWIEKSAWMGDLHAGYASVVRVLIDLVPWDRDSGDARTVSPVGYFFHRHELDQAANLNEIKRLTQQLGARLGPVFLGGEPLHQLQGAHRSGLLACWPYAGLTADELAGLTGRRAVDCVLPLGLRATGAWLRSLGRALGTDPVEVEALIDSEESRAGPRLEAARRYLERSLAGGRVAVVADTPSAAGWTLVAEELGLRPVLVVLVDRTLGGIEGFHRARHAAGAREDPGMRVIADPTLLETRELAGDGDAFDLAIRPDLALGGTGWESIPAIETGFPSNHKHFVYPLPEFGYTGAVALAQRVMDAAAGVH